MAHSSHVQNLLNPRKNMVLTTEPTVLAVLSQTVKLRVVVVDERAVRTAKTILSQDD